MELRLKAEIQDSIHSVLEEFYTPKGLRSKAPYSVVLQMTNACELIWDASQEGRAFDFEVRSTGGPG